MQVKSIKQVAFEQIMGQICSECKRATTGRRYLARVTSKQSSASSPGCAIVSHHPILGDYGRIW